MTTLSAKRFDLRVRLAVCASVLLLWAVPLAAHALLDGPDFYATKLLMVYSIPLLAILLVTALIAAPSIAAHPWRWSFATALVAMIAMLLLYFTVIPVAVMSAAIAAVIFPVLLKLVLGIVASAAT